MAKVYLTALDLQNNELLHAVLHHVTGDQGTTGVLGGKIHYRSDNGYIEWFNAVANEWMTPGTGEVSDHEGKTDPHSQYLTQAEGDDLYEDDGAVAAHEGAGDPHSQYQTQAESDARYVNEADHTKAVHDTMGIDAGTVDGQEAADLLARANHTGTQAISTVSGLQTDLNSKEETANKGVANGYAGLDGAGKVPSGQLPALAITETHVVADIAARDALTVQEGDVAVVVNVGSYIWDGTAWQELIAPDDITVGHGLTRSGDQISVVAGTGITVDAGGVQLDGEYVTDLIGAMVSGNTETGVTVTYQDADNTIDFAVAYGSAVALDGTASNGTGSTAARANHRHALPYGTEGMISTLSPSSTADAGDHNELARISHTHPLTGVATDTHDHDADYSDVGHVHPGAYATTIGNGSATSIAVTHNLDTTDVQVQIQDLSQSPDAVAEADYQITDANTVTVVFTSAPATDSIRVIIMAAHDVPANSNVVVSDDVTRIEVLTQSAYDALSPPNGNTLYVISG